MKIFLSGFVFAFVLLAVSIFCYFKYGYAPVATASTPWPFEMQLAHMALHARIEKEAPKPPTFQPSETDLQEGAHLYRQNCAVCHGLSKQPKTAIAAGMYPDPPQLLEGTGVTDDPASETYWKIANGIRLTGMPAYSKSLSDKQIWEISFLMAQANKLPASVSEILQKPAGGY